MKKWLCLLMVFVISLVPELAKAETTVKVAFIRDGYVWTWINGKEERITTEASAYHFDPQWSYDGKYILYQIENKSPNDNEIWVFNLETKQHKLIATGGTNPKWSPVENIVAFKIGGVLNVSNLEQFYNIALGIGDYEWFPDGQSFIASSKSLLRPDGWTNLNLYQIHLEKELDKMTSLTKNVKHLYTLPNELNKGDISLLAINASKFRFSPDSKWISFMVSPTASWSMDSDMVCVISSDGKKFEALDEVILHLEDPKWAPNKNLLGYIAGGGRIVFGFKNKELNITEMPVFQSRSLTPANFAELGFTWRNDDSLIVSRVKESEWTNDPQKRPDPTLYLIKIGAQMQVQISDPPKNYGDFQPNFLPSANKITWYRKKDFADLDGDLWMADPDGKNAKVWIKKISGYDFY
ncbi:MAG: TolB domain-containing protein [Neobacillus sp.]